jgi:hypothetical protein
MLTNLAHRVVRAARLAIGSQEAELLHVLAQSSKPLQAKDLGAAANPPQSGDVVRQNIRKLKRDLQMFSLQVEGKSQPFALSLKEKGSIHSSEPGYELLCREDALNAKQFWWPYLSPGSMPVLIVYAEPLFYRVDRRIFIRHQAANYSNLRPLKDYCPWVPYEGQPGSDFVSSGEVDAALILTRWFERLGVHTEHHKAKEWPDLDIDGPKRHSHGQWSHLSRTTCDA